MKNLILCLLVFRATAICYGQEPSKNLSDTLRKDALNVYFAEASSFIREEITYINYVRDRKVADLIIISTAQSTGSGGTEYTMFLEGQGRFSGMMDTLVYSSSPDETYEIVRDKQVNTLKQGLMRYVQKTPLSKHIDIRFTRPIAGKVSTDKWNNWVFRIGISGYASGESSYKSSRISGNISVSKVTRDWKFNFSSSYSSSKSTIETSDGPYTSNRLSQSANALLVRSISDHWSVGGSSFVSSSTYSNYDLRFSLMPGIEYDVYPYSEATRRQLRILYSVGFRYNNYTELTEFDKYKEGLLSHSLSASYEIIQKWGNAYLSASWSNYLRNFKENNASIYGSLNWRIVKGLSVNIGGGYSFIHDQISIPKEEASQEEILMRIKERRTTFSLFFNFGLRYTFGSIYNNVVNPRFGGSGSGYDIIY